MMQNMGGADDLPDVDDADDVSFFFVVFIFIYFFITKIGVYKS